MIEIERRDVAKLAVASGLACLLGRDSEAQSAEQGTARRDAAGAGSIQGITIPPDWKKSAGSNATPEELAVAFMGIFTEGLADLLARAVLNAMGDAVGPMSGNAPEWVKFIKGCSVDVTWSGPPRSSPTTVVAVAKETVKPMSGRNAVDLPEPWTIAVAVKGTL